MYSSSEDSDIDAAGPRSRLSSQPGSVGPRKESAKEEGEEDVEDTDVGDGSSLSDGFVSTLQSLHRGMSGVTPSPSREPRSGISGTGSSSMHAVEEREEEEEEEEKEKEEEVVVVEKEVAGENEVGGLPSLPKNPEAQSKGSSRNGAVRPSVARVDSGGRAFDAVEGLSEEGRGIRSGEEATEPQGDQAQKEEDSHLAHKHRNRSVPSGVMDLRGRKEEDSVLPPAESRLLSVVVSRSSGVCTIRLHVTVWALLAGRMPSQQKQCTRSLLLGNPEVVQLEP